MTVVLPTGPRNLTAPQRVRVATEILTTYLIARWWLARLSFPAAVTAARAAGPPAPHSLEPMELTRAAERLGIVGQRTLRPLPFDTRCLVRALVLTRMLSRRGIVTTFVLGVRSQPEFAAHAWLERAGVALLPTGPEFHRIAEL